MEFLRICDYFGITPRPSLSHPPHYRGGQHAVQAGNSGGQPGDCGKGGKCGIRENCRIRKSRIRKKRRKPISARCRAPESGRRCRAVLCRFVLPCSLPADAGNDREMGSVKALPRNPRSAIAPSELRGNALSAFGGSDTKRQKKAKPPAVFP